MKLGLALSMITFSWWLTGLFFVVTLEYFGYYTDERDPPLLADQSSFESSPPELDDPQGHICISVIKVAQ